jgi:hypothetical protein
MMGDTIQKCRGHLAVPKDLRPFAEGQVGGNDERGPLVELGDEVEQQLSAVFRERQIAQFIKYHEIKSGEVCGQLSTSSCQLFLFKLIDQVDRVEEPSFSAVPDRFTGDGEMGLSSAGSADEDDVFVIGQKPSFIEGADQGLVDRRRSEIKVVKNE